MSDGTWLGVVCSTGLAGASTSLLLHAPQIHATPTALKALATLGAAGFGYGLGTLLAVWLLWLLTRQEVAR